MPVYQAITILQTTVQQAWHLELQGKHNFFSAGMQTIPNYFY